MNCFGKDASTGLPVEIQFGEVIEKVVPATGVADLWIAPGFIDLQVNGFWGVDFNSPVTACEDIERAIGALFASGVTRFFPTVITGPPAAMTGALRNLADCRARLAGGAAIAGFHVEGPHISAEDGPRGAHPRDWVRPPSIDEFHRWQDASGGLIRMVTLAPEWPGAPQYIERVVAEGVVAAIGHTAANTTRIEEAVSAGASFSTHLGNGAAAVVRRHPNFLWDQLADDRLMAGFIVDGIHLDSNFLRAAIRAKGLERCVLVTDAATPAGAAPGHYRLGEQEIELTADNRVVLRATGKLAGSALRMDRGIENLMRIAGLSLAEAVRLATVNPAKAGRIEGRAAGLAPGDRADLVQFRFAERRIEIVRTWLGGREVFS
jgi:N-acetylglucosamine-6-phosphate deacetylase